MQFQAELELELGGEHRPRRKPWAWGANRSQPNQADCEAYQGSYLAWQQANNPGGTPTRRRQGPSPHGKVGRPPGTIPADLHRHRR